MAAKPLTCYCHGHCPSNELNGTCITAIGGYCFATLREVYDTDTNVFEGEWSYGCLPPDESGYMQCQGDLSPHVIPNSIRCCYNADMCNKLLEPVYIASDDSDFESSSIWELNHLLMIILPVCVIICLVGIIIFQLYQRRRKSSSSDKSSIDDKESSLGYGAGSCKYLIDSDTSSHDLSVSCGSGSGAGLPLLVQRTISKQLEMIKTIGRGRYGEVIRAKWRGEDVAVKVFATTEEASWIREQEVYQTVLLRHENILGYIAADIRGTGGITQMLLITDFHENGSLHDFLSIRILDELAMLRLMHTAISGICHLHTEVTGKMGKPAIAHRDIKSKNILVKRDGTCVIADFGLSVRYDSSTKEIDIAPNTRVGTKRYMAPEVLDETLHQEIFDCYKMADMYSFSLVLWEIARRCSFEGEVDEYQVPYYDVVPNDPSFEDMKKIICVDNYRPEISTRWFKSVYIDQVVRLMLEGWHATPRVRPTSLRMKKVLSRIMTSYYENDKKFALIDRLHSAGLIQVQISKHQEAYTPAIDTPIIAV